MGLFGFLKSEGITAAVAGREADSVLLDVRERNEYLSGHIPGAVNFPLSELDRAELPWGKQTPLYVYCLAGTRSGRAVRLLRSRGYENVKNIGGINAYRGGLEP